jgi:hypothetical protein
MKTAAVFSVILLLVAGCAEKKQAPHLAQHQARGMGNYYSIGVIDSADAKILNEVKSFFATNGIPIFIEGSLMYDVFVPKERLPTVQALLLTTAVPYKGFRGVWQKDNRSD